MMGKPDWLPDIVPVSPWTADTFNILYDIFVKDFKTTRPIYDGRDVWFFPEMENGREVIFWHLTHRDDSTTGERLPDLRRSERLPWVRKMLDNHQDIEVIAWDYEEGRGTINTYVWLKDHDFLVLMKKYRDGSRRMLTSFYVDYPNYKRKLEKKYSNRLK